MTETQTGMGEQVVRWAITAVLAIMAVRLLVAAAILAGKAIGAVEDGSLLQGLQFNPLELESPWKLAVNLGVVVLAVSLLTRAQRRGKE